MNSPKGADPYLLRDLLILVFAGAAVFVGVWWALDSEPGETPDPYGWSAGMEDKSFSERLAENRR